MTHGEPSRAAANKDAATTGEAMEELAKFALDLCHPHIQYADTACGYNRSIKIKTVT